MRKGTRVLVEFDDITAKQHSDEDLNCVVGRVVGWILEDTKRVLKLTTCFYLDDCDYKDRMSIPQGCVTKKEVI